MITAEYIKGLEDKHNVTIDADTMSYTLGSFDDNYGWLPIPAKWLHDYDLDDPDASSHMSWNGD